MDEINLNNFPSIDPDDQIEVIQSLFDMGNTRKALEVCDIALKYHPNNTALAILKNTLFENLKQESSKEIDLKPNDLKHKKLLIHRIESIANVFSKANKTQDAITLYTILKTIDKENFLACFRLGQIYFDNNTFAQAIKEFKSANTIDPFHIFTLKKLGLACYILGETFDALKYWMDGLILTIPTQNQEDIVFFKTHIRNAQNKVAGFNKSDRNMLFKKRQKRLRQLINDLKSALPSNTTVDVSDSLDHWFVADEDQDLSMNSSSTKMTSLADLPETSQVSVVQEFKKDPDLKFHKSNEELKEIAEKLNQYTLFKNLSPQERLTIANFTSFISLREDAYVFHENEPCYGIYFIERGLIEYSNQNFNLFFTEGQLFGHENILIHEKSMFTAKVKQECDLVFIDKAGLALIFSRNKPLAMHFLWYFWKSLSFQYQELKHIL
ncbi:cyclic nucleotide-binding domain-containing protein, partial [bacterium]|nr:cyclic nucleotide-binding domain-containing protein [bacterium]